MEELELLRLFGLEKEFIEFQKESKDSFDLYRLTTGDDK